jgi:asparagine synthase (glutamine-hydrolysing)
MCGIAGVISLIGERIPAASVRRMTDVQRHRGPDGEGFILVNENQIQKAFGNDTPDDVKNTSSPHQPLMHIENCNSAEIILGHRRLCIVDTSSMSHQPLCDVSGKYWITFNGEIYNYKSLRSQLEEKGFHFFTKTDTEVILNAYACWGENCVQHFNGMWAFVIYDIEKKKIFGSRDRFGVKPFYYLRTQSFFAFASEHKALLELNFYKKEINSQAAFSFLVLNKAQREEESLFKNIFELMPGHSILLSQQSFNIKQYYKLDYNRIYEKASSEKMQSEIENIQPIIENAISLRLEADVSVGTCLSGGIDSSVITGVISYLLKTNSIRSIGVQQKTFTACSTDQQFDESIWAKEMAAFASAEWNPVYPTADEFIRDYESLIWHHDLPAWSLSSYFQYRVMQLAHDRGVKVVLDGQGADELFAGYPLHFYSHYLEEKNQDAKEVQSTKKYLQENKLMRHIFLKYSLLRRLPFSIQKRVLTDLQYVDPDLIRAHEDQLESLIEKRFPSVNAQLHDEFTNGYLKELLFREDRNGMAHSIEARTPFADDINLIEAVFKIPGNFKIQKSTSKYLLREACHSFLPENIYARTDKKGFSSPNNQWLEEKRNDFKKYFDQDLDGFLLREKIILEYDKLFSVSEKPENFRLAKLVNFAAWKKIFAVS